MTSSSWTGSNGYILPPEGTTEPGRFAGRPIWEPTGSVEPGPSSRLGQMLAERLSEAMRRPAPDPEEGLREEIEAELEAWIRETPAGQELLAALREGHTQGLEDAIGEMNVRLLEARLASLERTLATELQLPPTARREAGLLLLPRSIERVRNELAAARREQVRVEAERRHLAELRRGPRERA